MNARRLPVTFLAILAIASCGPCTSTPPPPAGEVWRQVIGDARAPLLSAWQAPDGVLYVVGGNVHGPIVLRHDSDGWWEMDPGVSVPLWWVFGFSSSDVYAVGEKGTVTHFDGTRWSQERGGDAHVLYGAWGANRSELWAVGGAPTLADRGPYVLRTSGSGSWEPVAFPSTGSSDDPGNLFKVFGSAADDVWFVGEDGLGAHWNGTALARMTMPAQDLLVTGVSAARDRAYVVGGTGRPLLLRWDGSAWTAISLSDDQGRGLFGVAVAGERLVVGGERGLLLESRDGGAPEPVTTDAAIADTLHAIAPFGDGFVAVGGNLESTANRGVLYADVDLPSEPRGTWPEPGVPLDAGSADGGIDAGTDAGADDGGLDAGDDAGEDGGVDAGEDAGIDAGTDAGELDAGTDAGTDAGFGPGEDCSQNFSGCAPPDSCYFIFNSMKPVCTRTCGTAADCGDFGPNACCDLPGPQSVTPTCIPSGMNGVQPCP